MSASVLQPDEEPYISMLMDFGYTREQAVSLIVETRFEPPPIDLSGAADNQKEATK